MNINDDTEEAYKNGYSRGYGEGWLAGFKAAVNKYGIKTTEPKPETTPGVTPEKYRELKKKHFPEEDKT